MTAIPGQTTVKCAYCGNTVIVPEEMRPQPPTMPPPAANQPPSPEPPSAPRYAPPLVPMQVQPQPPPQVIYEVIEQPPKIIYRRSGGCLPRLGCGCGCQSCFFVLIGLIILGLVLVGASGISPQAAIGDVQTLAYQAINITNPQIVMFTAQPERVRNGGMVRIFWLSNADGQLARLGSNGTPTQIMGVSLAGQQTFTVSGTPGEQQVFRLTVTRNGASALRQIYITITR